MSVNICKFLQTSTSPTLREIPEYTNLDVTIFTNSEVSAAHYHRPQITNKQ